MTEIKPISALTSYVKQHLVCIYTFLQNLACCFNTNHEHIKTNWWLTLVFSFAQQSWTAHQLLLLFLVFFACHVNFSVSVKFNCWLESKFVYYVLWICEHISFNVTHNQSYTIFIFKFDSDVEHKNWLAAKIKNHQCVCGHI